MIALAWHELAQVAIELDASAGLRAILPNAAEVALRQRKQGLGPASSAVSRSETA